MKFGDFRRNFGQDGGALGSSRCDLGCQEGYTASEPVQGTCLGVPGSISAAYQHQAVIFTPKFN